MKRLFGLSVLLLLSTALQADVGDLTPVTSDLVRLLDGISRLTGGPGNFTKPTEGDGTVNKGAMIATLGLKSQQPSPAFSITVGKPSNSPDAEALKSPRRLLGNRSEFEGEPILKLAIDSDSPDAETPNLVRLDFSGQGEFEGKPVVPLKMRSEGGVTRGRIGPADIRIQRNGKTIPAYVLGSYYNYKKAEYRTISLSVPTALEGECRFGQKTYYVRIMDKNSNLRWSDKATPRFRAGKVVGINRGDLLLIGIKTEGSREPSGRKEVYYGYPVQVDGVWYDVKVSDDGTKVTAEPVDVKATKLKIDYDEWRIELVSKENIFQLSGGSTHPVDIPAGEYTVAFFSFDTIDREQGRVVRMWCGREDLPKGKAKTFSALAGQTVELKVDLPLTAAIKYWRIGARSVTMNFHLTDASGTVMDHFSVSSPSQGRGLGPQVEVYDAKGQLVHTGKFEYI